MKVYYHKFYEKIFLLCITMYLSNITFLNFQNLGYFQSNTNLNKLFWKKIFSCKTMVNKLFQRNYFLKLFLIITWHCESDIATMLYQKFGRTQIRSKVFWESIRHIPFEFLRRYAYALCLNKSLAFILSMNVHDSSIYPLVFLQLQYYKRHHRWKWCRPDCFVFKMSLYNTFILFLPRFFVYLFLSEDAFCHICVWMHITVKLLDFKLSIEYR